MVAIIAVIINKSAVVALDNSTGNYNIHGVLLFMVYSYSWYTPIYGALLFKLLFKVNHKNTFKGVNAFKGVI